jgi:hypothetical protein
MPKTALTYLLSLLVLLLLAQPSAALEPEERPFMLGRGWDGPGKGLGLGPGRSPYGAYCPKRHADRYGARQPVHSAAEARERLLQLFGADQVTISNLEERPRHFKANIVDKNGTLLDTVIIDRRSGRIRSIL